MDKLYASRRFTRKYTRSNFLFFLTYFLCNLAVFVLLTLGNHSIDMTNLVSVNQITDHVTIDDSGAVQADTGALNHLLSAHTAFVMLLDDEGDVVWSVNMPDTLPRHYDREQLASSSQAPFQRYPTAVRPMGDYLLAVRNVPYGLCLFHGAFRNSQMVQNNDFRFLYGGIYFLLLFNGIFSVVVFLHNNRRIKSLFLPILQGVEQLVSKNKIPLPEIGVLSDLCTILNRTSAYINQKDNARLEWVNGISHDVRTPLSCILGYSNEIEDDTALPADTREKARAIRVQSEKLSRLISNLNLVSRLEYSMQPMNLRAVDPTELVRHIIVEFLECSTNEAFHFDLELDAPIPDSIQADENLLRRMLENLIQNSINHNPSGCDITVSLNAIQPNRITFTVTDNGVGLPPEKVLQFNQKIFLEKPEAHGPAHGLGIQLVCKIAQVHHGGVVFSAVEPHGLSVSVWVPLDGTA